MAASDERLRRILRLTALFGIFVSSFLSAYSDGGGMFFLPARRPLRSSSSDEEMGDFESLLKSCEYDKQNDRYRFMPPEFYSGDSKKMNEVMERNTDLAIEQFKEAIRDNSQKEQQQRGTKTAERRARYSRNRKMRAQAQEKGEYPTNDAFKYWRWDDVSVSTSLSDGGEAARQQEIEDWKTAPPDASLPFGEDSSDEILNNKKDAPRRRPPHFAAGGQRETVPIRDLEKEKEEEDKKRRNARREERAARRTRNGTNSTSSSSSLSSSLSSLSSLSSSAEDEINMKASMSKKRSEYGRGKGGRAELSSNKFFQDISRIMEPKSSELSPKWREFYSKYIWRKNSTKSPPKATPPRADNETQAPPALCVGEENMKKDVAERRIRPSSTTNYTFYDKLASEIPDSDKEEGDGDGEGLVSMSRVEEMYKSFLKAQSPEQEALLNLMRELDRPGEFNNQNPKENLANEDQAHNASILSTLEKEATEEARIYRNSPFRRSYKKDRDPRVNQMIEGMENLRLRGLQESVSDEDSLDLPVIGTDSKSLKMREKLKGVLRRMNDKEEKKRKLMMEEMQNRASEEYDDERIEDGENVICLSDSQKKRYVQIEEPQRKNPSSLIKGMAQVVSSLRRPDLSTTAFQEHGKRKDPLGNKDDIPVGQDDSHRIARSSASSAAPTLAGDAPASFNAGMEDAYGEEEMKLMNNLPNLFREDFGPGDDDDDNDNNNGGKIGTQSKRQRDNSSPPSPRTAKTAEKGGGNDDAGKDEPGNPKMLQKRKLLGGLAEGHQEVAADSARNVRTEQPEGGFKKDSNPSDAPHHQRKPLNWTAVTENTRDGFRDPSAHTFEMPDSDDEMPSEVTKRFYRNPNQTMSLDFDDDGHFYRRSTGGGASGGPRDGCGSSNDAEGGLACDGSHTRKVSPPWLASYLAYLSQQQRLKQRRMATQARIKAASSLSNHPVLSSLGTVHQSSRFAWKESKNDVVLSVPVPLETTSKHVEIKIRQRKKEKIKALWFKPDLRKVASSQREEKTLKEYISLLTEKNRARVDDDAYIALSKIYTIDPATGVLLRRMEHNPILPTKQHQVVVPTPMVADLLRVYHEELHKHARHYGGFVGKTRMFERIAPNFYWGSMRQDIGSTIKNCVLCETARKRPIHETEPKQLSVKVNGDRLFWGQLEHRIRHFNYELTSDVDEQEDDGKEIMEEKLSKFQYAYPHHRLYHNWELRDFNDSHRLLEVTLEKEDCSIEWGASIGAFCHKNHRRAEQEMELSLYPPPSLLNIGKSGDGGDHPEMERRHAKKIHRKAPRRLDDYALEESLDASHVFTSVLPRFASDFSIEVGVWKDDRELRLGQLVYEDELKYPPAVRFAGQQNMLYSVMMVNPDDLRSIGSRQYLHWMLINVPAQEAAKGFSSLEEWHTPYEGEMEEPVPYHRPLPRVGSQERLVIVVLEHQKPLVLKHLSRNVLHKRHMMDVEEYVEILQEFTDARPIIVAASFIRAAATKKDALRAENNI